MEKQIKRKHFVALSAATFLCFAFLFIRISIAPSSKMDYIAPFEAQMYFFGFLFLVWNLFLAWLPYLVAFFLPSIYKYFGSSKAIAALIILIWLFFYPNAPYIITDFVHFRHRTGIPYWLDICMIASFAGTGMMLGLLSMFYVEKFLKSIMNPVWAMAIVLSCIPLSGLGIWIGRYQRWNSWDVVTRPWDLVKDVWLHISSPIQHAESLGIAVAFTLIIGMSYWMLSSLQMSSLKEN
ncbi:MAG: DUF1361 domain-containing protein [Saprospiraceae bacterium]